jgi:hypothetical protein
LPPPRSPPPPLSPPRLKDKKESVVLSAKDFLKDIGDHDQDEIEHERQVYFEKKKEIFNLDVTDESEEGERFGDIF